MITKTIVSELDFEMRDAAVFVQAVGGFSSSVKIMTGDKSISAKSIMGMIAVGITEGMTVTLAIEGADEEEAMQALERYFYRMG